MFITYSSQRLAKRDIGQLLSKNDETGLSQQANWVNITVQLADEVYSDDSGCIKPSEPLTPIACDFASPIPKMLIARREGGAAGHTAL